MNTYWRQNLKIFEEILSLHMCQVLNPQKLKEKPFLEPKLFTFIINLKPQTSKKHALFNDEFIDKRYHSYGFGVPPFNK